MDRARWAAWIDEHGEDDPVSVGIRAVEALERDGARVLVGAADVADFESMRTVVARATAEFGAIPTDCYSHTPAHAGAQQPGMTGQVKEEILTRFGELGLRVEDGRLCVLPGLLAPEALFGRDDTGWSPARLTVCGTPVGIEVGDKATDTYWASGRRWMHHLREGGTPAIEAVAPTLVELRLQAIALLPHDGEVLARLVRRCGPALTAIDACVTGRAAGSPARARRLASLLEFH